MGVHTVTLIPSGMQQPFPSGTLLSDALLDMGLALKTPCGGKGTCGKCRVSVEHDPEEVLACRTRISRDLRVHAGSQSCEEDVSIPYALLDSSVSVAVDIGTTSVRISLVDASSNASFEIASFLNPQRRFGHDVISRIAAARDASNLEALQKLVRKGIETRLRRALQSLGIDGGRIERVMVSGNTTMLYLLYGIEVEPLGSYPYTARTRDFPDISAGEIGLTSVSTARARALPVLSAFIGADLVGGLGLCHDAGITKNAFFIDLGTNGELFLLDGEGRPYAASCAMGPAIEGMDISWGMTADTGAITHILAGPGGLDCRKIGPGEPVGITGTALVDLVAILLDRGVISRSGAFSFSPDKLSSLSPLRMDPGGEARELRLWGPIGLSQKDIRSLQLAKGASLTASLLLLEAAGLAPVDIKHVLIAGAFGEHLDLERFRRLGFIPEFQNARFEFLGNTSLNSAVKACIDPDFPRRAAALRDKTREVVLSTSPEFQDTFIRSLEFPA
jgi:uncharacterized 2Fe-2S/4Fe-4S cluster protein (DUF4445 family)